MTRAGSNTLNSSKARVKDPPVTELALVLTSCTSLSPKKEEDSTEAATLFVNASTRYASIGDVKFTLGAVQFTDIRALIPSRV